MKVRGILLKLLKIQRQRDSYNLTIIGLLNLTTGSILEEPESMLDGKAGAGMHQRNSIPMNII
jgi:hypothetical protein